MLSSPQFNSLLPVPSNTLGKTLISLVYFILLICLFLVHHSTCLFTVHINSTIRCMLLHNKVDRKGLYRLSMPFFIGLIVKLLVAIQAIVVINILDSIEFFS